MKIFVLPNKSFRGPFTDDRSAGVGETPVTISPTQYSALCALNGVAVIVFDGTTFRQPTNAESLALPYDVALRAGYVIPGSSPEVRLAIEDRDRAQFVGLLSYLEEAGAVNPAAETIIDLAGQPHSYPVADLRVILVGYGAYYKSLVLAQYGS